MNISKKSHDKYKQLLALVPLALLLAGCGGGGGSGDDDGGASNNQTPVAVAGANLDVSRNFTVNLDGSASKDADGDALTFTWTQMAGPDVTGGNGSLSGETPVFQAPAAVDSIVFDLVVSDGKAESVADTVTVNVLEDANVAYFVDGDNGSDETGSGSRENPFASIAKALCEVTQAQQDIYVMRRANDEVYNETVDPCPGDPARGVAEILAIPTGTSLYGGYDENWQRDAARNPARVETLHHGFRFNSVDLNAWFSGFDVTAQDSPVPGASVYVVSAFHGDAAFYISDNQLIAGDVGPGASASPGSSYGLLVAFINAATIERNLISAGSGGSGLDVGIVFNTAASRGGGGGDARGVNGVSGGDGKGPSDYDGGKGGDAGTVRGENGTNGGGGQGPAGQGGCGGGRSSGAYDCRGDSGAGNSGRRGENGGNGGDGNSGAGGSGASVTAAVRKGDDGARGGDGGGGGGGGGGEANWGANGGGGGGGGGGGAGGAGGPGGPGGGASIGLLIVAVNTPLIDNNQIFSAQGGNGASGGQGQVGGAGGDPGDGADGNNGGGFGGDGGRGGSGGDGGRGGAGGGGPSYGIAIGNNIAPSISNNEINSGNGGSGGFGGTGGNGGDGGNSYAVFDSDINDGMVPALNNNTLGQGVPGDGGGTVGSGGSVGNIGQAGTRNW